MAIKDSSGNFIVAPTGWTAKVFTPSSIVWVKPVALQSVQTPYFTEGIYIQRNGSLEPYAKNASLANNLQNYPAPTAATVESLDNLLFYNDIISITAPVPDGYRINDAKGWESYWNNNVLCVRKEIKLSNDNNVVEWPTLTSTTSYTMTFAITGDVEGANVTAKHTYNGAVLTTSCSNGTEIRCDADTYYKVTLNLSSGYQSYNLGDVLEGTVDSNKEIVVTITKKQSTSTGHTSTTTHYQDYHLPYTPIYEPPIGGGPGDIIIKNEIMINH